MVAVINHLKTLNRPLITLHCAVIASYQMHINDPPIVAASNAIGYVKFAAVHMMS
jgi:hypothetical protein